MYIEFKGDGITGPARIGRVTFSKSGKSIHYKGKTFETLRGRGFKANYFNVETGEHYWISGCRKNGMDALYSTDVEIDEDVLVLRLRFREDFFVGRVHPANLSRRRDRCGKRCVEKKKSGKMESASHSVLPMDKMREGGKTARPCAFFRPLRSLEHYLMSTSFLVTEVPFAVYR